MKRADMKTFSYSILLIFLLLTGCSTTPQLSSSAAEQEIRTDLLSFIIDGETTREEVLLQLGRPSGQFERDRILTYQIWIDQENNARVFWPRRPEDMAFIVRYVHSLVLVFDSNGVLEKHNLIGTQ